MKIACTCVDSGMYSHEVYKFCGPRFHRKIFAIKGSSDPRAAIWPRRPSRPKAGRVSGLYILGTIAAKETVRARLAITRPGPGYCHFPERDPDFFEMLLSETPVNKWINGVSRRVWVKLSSARNEALDARIYCYAALHALKSYGFNLDAEADRVANKNTGPQRKLSDFAKLGSDGEP